MIATIVFSLVLLIAMAALINISKLYYKGITNSRTQEQTRKVMGEISQSIQYSRQDIITPSLTVVPNPQITISTTDDETATTGFFCIGPRRYTYVMDRQLKKEPDTTTPKKERRHVLWVDTPVDGCAWSTTPVLPADMTLENPCENPLDCNEGVELMSENMRLTKLAVSELSAGSDLWSVTIGIAYGEDDLLTVVDNRYVCEGSRSVAEFCAISELSTTVNRRL
jgi:hypothetical protein